MATPKQIRQRIGWALAQRGNVNEALAKMDAHLEQAGVDLDEWIEAPTDPVEPPVEDPLPGQTEPPTFTEVEGGVRASWPAAQNATHYRVTREGGDAFDVDQTHAVLPLVDGDWVCVEPRNATGAAEASCNTYEAAAEPEPPADPPSGDWALVHDFSPAAGETLPNGVTAKLADGSWVPGGKAERTADGYLMTYLEGMEDGRGPGQIVMRFPAGHRRLMCEYEIALSSNFEDHPVFNKIAHYRTQQPAHEMGPNINHGAKFIDKFKGYRIGYAGDSGTGFIRDQLVPPESVQDSYPDYYGGYNSVVGNVRQDRFVPEQTHTVRCEWTWMRQDAGFAEANWYRLRWWLDGELQGDFPEIAIWGGPEFIYWEIAPTWGGNGGHIKTREDWMLISRIATWVG